MTELIEFLRQVPMLADLPDQDLEQLAGESRVISLDHGELLFGEGAFGDAAYVVQTGLIEILKRSHGHDVLLSCLIPGDLFGEMALLDNSPRMAGARARGQTTVVAITQAQFDKLIQTSHSATNAMFSLVVERLKSTEVRLRQSERMAQLGTLTAGVAHELNNPAAAAKRGADQLGEAIDAFAKANRDFIATSADSDAEARHLIDDARARVANAPTIDQLTLSDLEYDIGSWLDEHKVAEAWMISNELAAAGYTKDQLESIAAKIGPHAVGAVATLIASTLSVTSLLSVIGQTTGQISSIVNALKSYSFLDQAPVQQVKVLDGINNTLLLLRGKIPDAVTVKVDCEPDVPMIDAFGSELNQVWTHLVDNALDAMNGKGQITITARKSENRGVIVQVADSGPGIPTEIQHRIFDAFFTTKEPGKGTGLGLHTVFNIVVNKHGGEISVESEPGHTVFTVRLPPKPPAQGS